MGNSSLLDRIWTTMLDSDRVWSSAEIAALFLRLRGDGPPADALVRKILAGDRRLREDPSGLWKALAAPAPTLDAGAYLLCWIEGADQAWPRNWRVHLLPCDCGPAGSGKVGSGAVSVSADQPEAWEEARKTWPDRRLATLQLGPLQRWQQWMGRFWALPEWERPPLDLLAWVRLALIEEGVPPALSLQEAQLSALSRRWALGPVREEGQGGVLFSISALLDRLLERHGGRTEEDVSSAFARVLGARPVDWERYAFSRKDLEALPETSGVYRFYDASGALLYVGKSLNLARRVSSYFRPLPPEAGKREQLIRRIHRMAVEPAPSELEAMVLEARAIRLERPPWNVQVEVHPSPLLPPQWWWPVVFLAPGRDPHRASAFLLRDPASGCLFHLPREEQGGEAASLAAWLDAILQDEPAPENDPAAGPAALSSGPGALVLEPPEAHLVLRFYLRARERCHRVDSIHFTSGYALADALLRLARGTQGDEEPLDLRPGPEVALH